MNMPFLLTIDLFAEVTYLLQSLMEKSIKFG